MYGNLATHLSIVFFHILDITLIEITNELTLLITILILSFLFTISLII